MQRWIVPVVVTAILVLGAGAFGFWTLKQNSPHPIYFAIPLNPDVPEETRGEIAKQLQAKLKDEATVKKISAELALEKEWDLATPAEAEDRLRSKITVTEVEGDLSKRIPPAIHIAIKGKKKEKEVSGKIATRVMKDVWDILGIEAPKK